MAEKLTILMYHKIERLPTKTLVPGHYVDPDIFRKQMGLLKMLGYRPIRLDEAMTKPLPKRPAVITFDDGYQNFLTNALPVLREHQFPSTVFLVSDELGGTNSWDVRDGDVSEPLMNLGEIESCLKDGVEFGSHTVTHARLAGLPEERARTEIARSKSELEARLKIPISTFCYPYGSHDDRTRQMVENAGYICACSTEKGINGPDTDRFALRRINVRRDTRVAGFAMKLWRARLFDR